MTRRLLRTAPAGALLALSVFSTVMLGGPTARADLRLWEEPAEADSDRVRRYFDFTAFAQPGFIFRFDGDDENNPNAEDTPWLQRARMGFRTLITPWLTFRVELELAPVVVLQDAYFDLQAAPALSLKLGQFAVPFLRAYEFNELNLGFLDRPVYTPQAPDRGYLRYLAPRDIGLMVHGTLGSDQVGGSGVAFQYWAGAFVGSGPNTNVNNDDALLYAARGQVHLLGLPHGAGSENDLARNAAPRVAVATGVYSNCDSYANWNRGFTVDTEARYQGLYASAAFVWFRNGRSMGLGNALGYQDFCVGSMAPTTDPAAPRETLEFVSRGAHAQLQYVLPRSWLGFMPGQDLEVVGRVDWVDPQSPYKSGNPLFGGGTQDSGYVAPGNYADAGNSPTRLRLTFGLGWFPVENKNLRVQLNYQLNRELEDVQTADGVIVGIKNDVLWLQLTAGL